jgi:hypothetical protein
MRSSVQIRLGFEAIKISPHRRNRQFFSATQTADTSVSANNTAFQQLAQAYTMLADLGTPNLNSSAYQAVTSTAQSLLT